ncbi:receptor-like protein 43 [Miscanthus floridulus]|uniref:receptor-like protein 43 n=1 Tax=Miscanthus floridulus TaxID=154761 RepID=UPI0034579FD1
MGVTKQGELKDEVEDAVKRLASDVDLFDKVPTYQHIMLAAKDKAFSFGLIGRYIDAGERRRSFPAKMNSFRRSQIFISASFLSLRVNFVMEVTISTLKFQELSFLGEVKTPALGNKLVGTAILPVADLAAAGDDAGLRNVSYQVSAPDGKPNGTLSFAYAISGGPSDSSQLATRSHRTSIGYKVKQQVVVYSPAAASQSQALQLSPAAPGRHGTGACIPRERDVLLAFKRGISGDPAGRLASWHEGDEDCCRWSGVRCSNWTGHVIGLRLGNDMYTDDPRLHPEDTALSGQISPSLLSLHHLESLDLSLNNLSGPAGGGVPEFLGLLKNLRYLDLYGMPLSGSVPPQLGNLSKLHYLDLSGTDEFTFFPDLYSTDISWLSSLPLRYLDMGSVNLSGIVGWAHVVNMVPSLKVLRLDGCSLTSANQSLPHLNLTGLAKLTLSDNYLDHPVASCWFWNLTSLGYLDLAATSLYGPVPDALGCMMSLQALEFSRCTSGSIDIMTANMTNLCELERIDFSGSDFDGSITDLFERLPQCSSNKLKELNLGFNNFSGVLPNHLGRWARLVTLDLSNNQITGQLPSEIENMTSLVTLSLDSNQLTGQIPRLPPNLHALDISRNYLSGPLPSNFGAPKLSDLSLFSNHISGHIPHSICELNLYNQLNLGDNHLEGEFPQCSEPRMTPTLILSNNMLSGKLDTILETYPELQILDLAWNKFTGNIPETITNLGGLIYLDLAGNNLSGALPHHLSNFMGMKATRHTSLQPANSVFLSQQTSTSVSYPAKIQPANRPINLSVTTKGQERYYFDYVLYEMVNIDMSSNHLTGVIPEEITSLDGVVNLNLSRNNLTGKFSERIGVMKSLESLDLSENKLCGEIPQSLSNLSYLSFMDLSHNNLTGRIPSGGQLDTLYTQNPLMYDGNIGLCGYPLQKNCTTNNREPKHGEQKGDGHDDEVLTFSFGLGIGYVVGLWMVFCVILFNKTWRIAYFRLFDKVFDKVYVSVVVTWARWAK